MTIELIIKKNDLHLVKCDFKLVLNVFTAHIKTDFQYNTSIIHMEKFYFVGLINFI